jgi:hypothetical protein
LYGGYPYYDYYGGYPYDGYGAYPSYGYATDPLYGATPSGSPSVDTGSLRLKIKPKDAQVYVDGSYVGVVDNFNGYFQHLNLITGRHHVSVRESGYAPLEFDVTIQPHVTTTFNGVLPRSSP